MQKEGETGNRSYGAGAPPPPFNKPKRAAAAVEEGEALGKNIEKKLKNGVELRINAGF